VYIISQEI